MRKIIAVAAAGRIAVLLMGCAVLSAGCAASRGPDSTVGVAATAAGSSTDSAADSATGVAPGAPGKPSKHAASPAPTPHKGAASPKAAPAPAPTHGPTPAVRRASPSPASGHAGLTAAAGPAPTSAAPQASAAPPLRAGSTGGAALAPGYSKTADAQAMVDAARAASRADGKPVLLGFGATWCGNCLAMDRALRLPSVQSALAAYHFVQIDIGDGVAANMQILGRYDAHPAGGSYGMPVLIVLTPSGAMRVDTAQTGNPVFDETHFAGFLRRWAA